MQTQIPKHEPSENADASAASNVRERKHTRLGKAIIEGLKDALTGKISIIRKEELDDDIKQLLK